MKKQITFEQLKKLVRESDDSELGIDPKFEDLMYLADELADTSIRASRKVWSRGMWKMRRADFGTGYEVLHGDDLIGTVDYKHREYSLDPVHSFGVVSDDEIDDYLIALDAEGFNRIGGIDSVEIEEPES